MTDNDKLAWIEQKSRIDGSNFIKEDLLELKRNAYKFKIYAYRNNIYIKEVNLENMTKKN